MTETLRVPPPPSVLTAPQQIAATIKEWIRQGVLKPGDRLPAEPELADTFSTSRPTIRAALQELCATEVLSVKRGRTGGYRVSEMSLELLAPRLSEFITLSLDVKTISLLHVYEVRRALELLMAELAARRRTEEQVAELETLVAQVRTAPPTTAKAALELDLRFHDKLARCTNNDFLIGLEAAMDSAYREYYEPADADFPPDEALVGLPELARAVKLQNERRARQVMERHLEYSDRYFGMVGAAATAAPVRAAASRPG